MPPWAYLLIGGAIVLAAGLVAVPIYLLKSPAKPKEAEERPPAWADHTGGTFLKPPPLPAEPKSAEEAPPKTPEDAMLRVVGTLTVAHLTQTDLNIGLLGDAVEKQVYDATTGKNQLAAIEWWTDRIEQELTLVPPSSFKSDADRKGMEIARTATTLLRGQAKELRAYWDSATDQQREEHVRRYKEMRAETRKLILKLNNLEE
jgi:hypothetical protein